MECDLCGKTATAKATIEGAQLTVCALCAKHGTNVRPFVAPTKVKAKNSSMKTQTKEELIETVRPDIAKLLRQYRESQKLNQEQFAAKLQIKLSTYHQYENGSAKPDITTAHKLEKILGTPLVVHMKVGGATLQHNEARSMQIGDFIRR